MSAPFKLTPPAAFVPYEFDEQCMVFEYFKHEKLAGIDLLYATLNGVRVSIGTARKMKRAGMTRGALDLCLDVARGSYHGLRIEMKRIKGGTLSPEQKAWISRLREEGYKAEVARGAKEAITQIVAYLAMPRTQVIGFAEESK